MKIEILTKVDAMNVRQSRKPSPLLFFVLRKFLDAVLSREQILWFKFFRQQGQK